MAGGAIKNARVLVAQPGEEQAADTARRLKALGYDACVQVCCPREAAKKAKILRPDLALVDLGLGDGAGGLEAGERIGRKLGIPVVYLTDGAGPGLLEEARETGPYGYVLSDAPDPQLDLNIRTAIAMHGRETRRRRTEERLRKADNRLKKALAELKEQNQLMRAVFRDVGDGVVVTDEKGKVLISSRSALDILGAPPPGARRGQRDWTPGFFLTDGDTPVPPGELPIERALRGEDTQPRLLFVRSSRKPDGIFISANARTMRDASGAIQGAISVFRDISRFMQAERKLKETLEELQRQAHTMEVVLNSISDGVLVADQDNRLIISNPSAHRIVGIPGEAKGTDRLRDGGFFFPDKQTRYPISELPLMRAIRGEECDDVHLFVRNPGVPEGVFVSVNGRPLRDPDGEVQGGVVVYRDITDLMQAEEALAQAFSQGRLEIVDTILHNIGNAINSVATGVGTIREGLARNVLEARLAALAESMKEHQDDLAGYLQDNPQGRKAVSFLLALAEDFAGQHASINKVARRVERRVAHIVDIIRTQRSFDSMAMARTDVGLRQALNAPVRLLQESIEKRGIKVAIDCRNAPGTIRVQESRFNQMLVNIIKNAIEAIGELQQAGASDFKPRIRVRARARKDFLVIDVIDNGAGIEEKRARRIFAAGYTTKERGSGLGLHSAANYVVGSGGRIYPVSAGQGKGTTMRVELRLSSVQPRAENSGDGRV